MNFIKERHEVIQYGKALVTHGLTKGTGGNVSVYSRENEYMLISPSAMNYSEIELEDVVVMDLAGRVIEGKRKPSTEHLMHLALYRGRSDVNAVVHTHSPYCTALSCIGSGIPATHYLIGLAGEDVKCAPYATYGTEELAMKAFKGMEGRFAVLLANHGLLAAGVDLASAFYAAEEVEMLAQVYVLAKSVGRPRLLPKREVRSLMSKFRNYGQDK